MSMNLMHASAQRINERTSGQVTVECYGASELVSEHDVFKAVQNGQLDIAYGSSGYGSSAGLLPHAEAGQLPIWAGGEAGCLFTKAVLDKYVRADMEALGVVPIFFEMNMATDFGYFVAPYVTDVWTTKIYSSLDELKGTRIMSQTETTHESLKAIGIVPVNIPYSEVPAGLKDGSLDGALLVTLLPLMLGIADVVTCCVRIGCKQSEDSFTVMNKKVAESLPSGYMDIITDEVRNWWRANDRTVMIKHAQSLWSERIKAGKIKIVELTAEEKARCNKLWDATLTDAWIKKQVAAGFKDAKAYLDDLKKIEADILASGVPGNLAEPLR